MMLLCCYFWTNYSYSGRFLKIHHHTPSSLFIGLNDCLSASPSPFFHSLCVWRATAHRGSVCHSVQALKRNWIEYICVCFCVCVCARTCYQCLTGGRLWLLFCGTVQETNDISTPKGGGRQLDHSLFEELQTKLYRNGEKVMSMQAWRRRRRGLEPPQQKLTGKQYTEKEQEQEIYREVEKLAEVNTDGKR